MDSLPAVATDGADDSLWPALATLESLLASTSGHAGIPSDTQRCLTEAAACVRELAARYARLERVGGETPAGPEDERRRVVRGLVGSDTFEPARRAGLPARGAAPGQPQVPGRPERSRLTPQEQRILELIAEGCTNRQIAAELYLAEKTVKNYVSNLLRKLGMERRTQAAVYAARLHRELTVAAGTPA